MSSSRESNLKLYSLGIVAVTKERGSDAIKVTPIEELTMTNKKLSEEKSNYKVEVPDAKGVSRSSEVESDIMMVAKWIPFGHSNRLTAPDVVQGETVVLFRFGDTDEYYWTTIFREAKLRRLETVNYGYSNIPGGMVAFNKETSYWFEWSTHDKYVQIHTSKNDGEPFTYDLIFNTGKGFFQITDDVGNHLMIDSANTTNTLENVTGTYYKQEEERINEYSKEYKYTESTKIFRYAVEYICDRSPIIYLNSPEILMGKGECGADISSTAYHDKPFVRVSESSDHARIGSGQESYSHYDGQNQDNVCSQKLSDKCNERVTEAASSIKETTGENKEISVGQDYNLDVKGFTTIKSKDQVTIESDKATRLDKRVELDMSYSQFDYPQTSNPFVVDWANQTDRDELHFVLKSIDDKLNYLEAKNAELAGKLETAEAKITELQSRP